MQFREWLPAVRDTFQTLFFIVIGVVTILTYLKAKKTLLQPIRTEVFKEQLKLFSSVLEMFSGKSEVELRNDFHFDELFFANVSSLLDQYGAHFFGIEVDEDQRPYNNQLCPGTIVPEHMLVDASLHLAPDQSDRGQMPSDPRTKAAIWSKYKYDAVRIPKGMSEMENELHRLIGSPLAPRKLVELLEEYSQLIHRNIGALRKILTACAAELPEKYPDAETLAKASLFWINNRFVHKFEDLEEKAREISDYLRTYFKIESLLES